jgi:hypothetical protein
VWLVPYDEFTRRVRSTGFGVVLERLDGDRAVPVELPPVRTLGGALAYPALGRRARPSAPPQRYRVRLDVVGHQALYPADDEPFSADVTGVEFTVHPYDDENPPAEQARPRLLRLLPGAAFAYPPGVRTVSGTVVDAGSSAPLANVLVESTGLTDPDLVAWRERTLSDAAGRFRLPLRWEGEKEGQPEDRDRPEVFRLAATERPGRTGALTVRLPGDAGPHVIEIREQ